MGVVNSTDLLRSTPSDSSFAEADQNRDNVPDSTSTGPAHNFVSWHMVVEEDVDGNEYSYGYRFTGQFPPESLSRDVSYNIAAAGAYGRKSPLIQWTAGELETVSFGVKLWSDHRSDQTAKQRLEILEGIAAPVEQLKRPVLVRFFWGDVIPGGILCFIQSLGGINYEDVRLDGTARSVTLQITLHKFTQFVLDRNVDTPMEQTPKYVVRDGDTYEMIALRRYGNPIAGVPLRIMNPRSPMEPWAPADLAELQAGESIKLFDKSDVEAQGVKPTCHMFNLSDPNVAAVWKYYFSKRGMHTNVIPRR